jgi:hypothetical protein
VARLAFLIAILIVCACAPAAGGPTWTYDPPASVSPRSAQPSPPNGAGPTTEPSDGPHHVTSERFGYSLSLPAGWTYVPATEDWPPGVYPSATSAFTDRFDRRPASFPAIDIQTQLLDDGMTPEAFLAWLDGENARLCTVESTEEIVIDGATGRFQQQTCGYNSFEATVFDGDRVYLIYWLGATSLVDEERPVFEAILDTFRFAPPAAADSG